jgi:hypothetical protein
MILQTSQTTQAALINPHPGLVGWWRFDEGSGTVAGDSSGNGNSGTINGATWGTGIYGQALSFDGATNYVTVPNNANLHFVTPFSISAWIYLTAYSYGMIINDYAGSYRGYIFLMRNNGVLEFQVGRLSDTTVSSAISSVLNLNTWYYVVGVYDGVKPIVYVNAVGVNGSSYSPIEAEAGTIVLGKALWWSGYYFNGVIDEVRIYNRDLSAAEIQQDFQNGPDFSSNLLAKVPMGTTQVITTLSWQGTGSINVTIVSPSQTYTESMVPVYQKTTYSTSGGTSSMLNIKRLSVSVNALPSDQNWNVTLTFDNPVPYQITVEVQK